MSRTDYPFVLHRLEDGRNSFVAHPDFPGEFCYVISNAAQFESEEAAQQWIDENGGEYSDFVARKAEKDSSIVDLK